MNPEGLNTCNSAWMSKFALTVGRLSPSARELQIYFSMSFALRVSGRRSFLIQRFPFLLKNIPFTLGSSRATFWWIAGRESKQRKGGG